MKRRILAFLLALVMVVGMVPTSVFADMAEGTPEEVTSVTEETEAPEEATEETEEVPSEPEETEGPEETQEPEQTEETTVPEEEPEVYEGTVGEQVALEDAAPDADVTFTVSVQGVLGKTSEGEAAVELPVTVEDLNSDGILTYDEALVALHDEYCPDGYTLSGNSVTKLWGTDGHAKFVKNGEYLEKAVNWSTSTVADGDQLYAAVVKDDGYLSDVYASFDQTEVTVETGESFTLKLTGTKNDNFSGGNVTGAVVGTWDNGTFTALKDTKTDTVGKVTLSFDKAGTYIVSASGTVAGEYYDFDIDYSDDIDCPITAPYCVVTVNEAEKPAVTADVTFTVSNQGVLAQTANGKAVVDLPITVKDLDGDGILTFHEASVALHEAYCPGGYELKGTKVENFWNEVTDPTGSYLFTVNGDLFRDSVPEKVIETGDKLYVAILKDQTYYSDTLTYFDQKQVTVYAGQDVTLKLQGSTAMVAAFDPKPLAGIQAGTWSKGVFTPMEGAVTGEDGSVTLHFGTVGTYIVSASGAVKDVEVQDWSDGSGNLIKVDSPITAPYCVVKVEEVPITSVLVNFKIQDDDGGQIVTAFGEEVSSDLAESYGYTDKVIGEVSALDVLVRAHELALDSEFDEDTAKEYLEVNSDGWINNIMGYGSVPLAFFVNGQLPGNGAYTVNQAKVVDGDTVQFAMYADVETWSDRYVWLETADGQRLTGQTLYAGLSVDLVAMGNSAMMGGEGTPVAGAKLGGVDMQTGEVTDLKVVSDAQGKLSFTIPERMHDKTICLTLMGEEMMGELSIVKVGEIGQETDLVNIQLGIGGGTSNTVKELALSPEFEHTTKSYQVYVPNIAEEDARYLWVKAEYIPHCTAGLEFHNISKNFSTEENRQWVRLGKLTPGAKDVLTLVSSAPKGYTRTYTIDIYTVSQDDIPTITQQPQSGSYYVGQQMQPLTVEAEVVNEPDKLSYQWYVNTENTTEGATPIAGATESAYALGTAAEAGTKYYFCTVSGALGESATVTSELAEITVVTAEKYIHQHLEGTGTSEDPYRISKAEDYVFVSEMVAAGYSFAGQYLAQTADITLPEGWTPIGCLIDPSVGHISGGKNARFFSGHLDGQDNTLTVPEGGLPLFAYVTDAYVQNLKIYGSRIEGYGLVNNLEGVGLKGNAITIDGVTLLSGTRTKKSGLIGTYITGANAYAGCSGAYLVTIRNCVAEEGVVIGYDGTESNIGTFAGRVNGTIENCKSYATVQGVDNVGGIAGILDNSYTTFNITGCTFGGTVEASGELAGGILGSGYIGAWADNAVRPNIEDCVVTGSITGSNMVGGIQGGDKSVIQTYKTSPNHITGNTFSGVVTATNGKAVGAIVGYYRGLNAYDTISGNRNTSKGALLPIGQVEYVDTSAANHEKIAGLHYFDSSSGKLPTVPGYNWWQRNVNRTDDPLGANAETLCTSGNIPAAAKSNVTTLLSGASTTMKAMDPETGKALNGKQITWALVDAQDAIYATVSASGAVKAKTVMTKVSVTFAGTLKGSYYGTVYQTITILPKVTQVEILKDGENVTGKTLSLNSAKVGETLKLDAKLYPMEDVSQDVTWKSSNTRIAQIVPNGTVSFAGKTGTVTITATSNDGSRVAASVKLQVGVLTESVKIDTPAAATLRSGKSLTLKATVKPDRPTVSGVTFKLVNASDSAYVSVSTSGKVSAKTVNEPHKVEIIAVSKDAAAVESDPITLTILPKNVKSLILKSGDKYVTNGKVVRNVNEELTLKAYTLDTTGEIDEAEAQDVVWISSNAKVASVENGKVICRKAGTAKITAAVGKTKVTVTVQVTNLVSEITIRTKNEKDSMVVASGKTLALKTTVTPADAKQKAVTWSIIDGSSYAKISSSGVVTAYKNLTAPVTITVKAVAKDGSGAEATQKITINPIALGVTVSDVNHERTTGTLVWDMEAARTAQFTAKVYPANAQQSVTWKSSNAKVAAVDENGKVTCLKTGTVTITATANDGSGKKASFKLNVVKRMKDLKLVAPDTTVEGGKSLQLKATFAPSDTTNKKLTWKIGTNTVGAKISSSGKLTTKKVKEDTPVTVTVSSTDGSGLSDSCTITITPPAKK